MYLWLNIIIVEDYKHKHLNHMLWYHLFSITADGLVADVITGGGVSLTQYNSLTQPLPLPLLTPKTTRLIKQDESLRRKWQKIRTWTLHPFLLAKKHVFPEIVWWPEKSIILKPSAPIVLDSLRSTVLSNGFWLLRSRRCKPSSLTVHTQSSFDCHQTPGPSLIQDS